MRAVALIAALALCACTPAGPSLLDEAVTARAATAPEVDLPALKSFGTASMPAPVVSNIDLARDLLDLSFALENGRQLDRFTRFEGPITLRVTGRPPPTLERDLATLLHRLQREAGIDITRTDDPGASLTIEALPRREIRRAQPQAACFVVPGLTTLADYSRARRSARTSWAALTERRQVGIFLPNDVSPQEIRDCLHEEVAQALGPLNDLYRLPDSVFNDDNMHGVLTGFDMVVLRATYDPALRSGMSRTEVAARLPALLSRINPDGDRRAPRTLAATPRPYADAIQTALGRGTSPAERRRAANRALRVASEAGLDDHRLAFAHYTAGRLGTGRDAAAALAHFEAADRIYAAQPATRPHRARVAVQRGAAALARGDAAAAEDIVTPYIAVAASHENAALMATLMLLRADALDLSGRREDAAALRLDSLGWARYGFGPDWALRTRPGVLAALDPRGRRG